MFVTRYIPKLYARSLLKVFTQKIRHYRIKVKTSLICCERFSEMIGRSFFVTLSIVSNDWIFWVLEPARLCAVIVWSTLSLGDPDKQLTNFSCLVAGGVLFGERKNVVYICKYFVQDWTNWEILCPLLSYCIVRIDAIPINRGCIIPQGCLLWRFNCSSKLKAEMVEF